MVIPNPCTGLTVAILDEYGKGTQSFHGALAEFSTRKATEGGGSDDWLREIWVTETQVRLDLLKTILEDCGDTARGTSGSSLHATLCTDLHPDTPGTPKVYDDRCIIALGDSGQEPDGEPSFRAHTLLVSPVAIKPGHPLYELWKSSIANLEILEAEKTEDKR